MLAYMDDIDIIAKSISDLKDRFNRIEKAAEETELVTKKNEDPHITTSRIRACRIDQNVIVRNYNFEVADIFK